MIPSTKRGTPQTSDIAIDIPVMKPGRGYRGTKDNRTSRSFLHDKMNTLPIASQNTTHRDVLKINSFMASWGPNFFPTENLPTVPQVELLKISVDIATQTNPGSWHAPTPRWIFLKTTSFHPTAARAQGRFDTIMPNNLARNLQRSRKRERERERKKFDGKVPVPQMDRTPMWAWL